MNQASHPGEHPHHGRDISVIVLNSYFEGQGGASRVAIDSAIGLANRGVDVTFVGSVGPISSELSRSPVKTVCLMQRDLLAGGASAVLQGLWNAPAYRAMSSLLEAKDPSRTVVHLHSFSQALSTSPVRCALDKGFRVICTLHEYFCACPTGAFFDFATNEPCPRKGLSFDCITTNCDKRSYVHKLYRVARSAVQVNVGRLPNGVKDYIGLSQRSVQIMQPYLPPDARVHFVPNPVKVARLPPVNVARNRAIVAVGRLDEEKGIRVLLQAARQAGTQLTLIGDGALREYAEASGLCRVTGWLSREGVMAELEAARCLVFPSLWHETFGLVVDEAAARGIPAIVSDLSAAAERVVDGVTGWHVRAADSEDLARGLDRVTEDPVVEAAGRAAYARWWDDPPTLDRHVSGLLRTYEQMLNRAD